MRYFFLFLFLSGLITSAFSQEAVNKKAQKFLEKADEQIKGRQFYEAIDNFKRAIDKQPNYVLAHQKLANLYSFLRLHDSAYAYYNSYYDLSPKSALSDKALRALSTRFFNKGHYGKAQEAFNHYKDRNTFAVLSIKDSIFESSIKFSLQATSDPLDLEITKLSQGVNRFTLQYFPVLTIDNSKIYYTRRLGAAPQYDEDIMMSQYVNGEWTPSKGISRNINTPYNEGACSISADGRTLIFTACEGRESFGNCDLYISRYEAGVWTRPENLGRNVNSVNWDSQPSISADGRKLYFASNRAGGYGKRDIWMSTLSDQGWQPAENLGKPINTPFDETTPFIHVNGESLFFASEGHVGLGGFDIYLSEIQDNTWSVPKNVGYPINNFDDQSAMFIAADGRQAFFTSDERDRSYIYRFQVRADSLVSRKATYLTGVVSDKETSDPLEASILLYDLESQDQLYQTTSSQQDGRYLVSMNADGDYGVYVTAPGYLFEDLHIDLTASFNLVADTLNVQLSPIADGQKMILENIYFDFDSYVLLPKSESEIKEVSQFLKTNPVLIEIGGHTDAVGSSEYNQKLSENRARAVFERLVQLGVRENQMRFKGYGASQPLIDDKKTVKNQLNRRIEFKIIQKLVD